jgi:hypothetical protein
MKGEAIIEVTFYRRDNVQTEWRAKMLSRHSYYDVYEAQFKNNTVNVMVDEHGELLQFIEVHTIFHNYSVEE